MVDHCQHVGMGCCTNLTDFCRRVGIDGLFRRDRTLHFIGPDGRSFCLEASRLPAPLHLLPAFGKLAYLSARERLAIGRAMWKLMRWGAARRRTRRRSAPGWPSVGNRPRSIELFWSVILVSALGEQLDRASLAAARKVIVDGFLSAADAYVVDVPRASLGALYGERSGGGSPSAASACI